MKTKTLSIKSREGRELANSGLPSFSATGSIKGMKDKFYGKNARLIRCGSYIYNCDSRPDLYDKAH